MCHSKKTVFLLIVGLLVFAGGLQAAVEELYVKDNPATKLGRGLTNVIFSPGEYIVQTAKLMKTHDPFTAYFGGFVQGTAKMIQRIGGGVVEIATFPIPLPKEYKPLMEPPTTVAALQDDMVLNVN